MTEEEKAVLRRIAETTKRIVEQQERIGRLMDENQPTDAAVDLLCALLDSVRVEQGRLDTVRSAAKAKNPSV